MVQKALPWNAPQVPSSISNRLNISNGIGEVFITGKAIL